jgi:solute carrier family 35 (UDP-galactose transporter), member B1
MLFGVLFAHKRYSLRKYFYVLLIVIGMAIFLYKPGKQTKHFQFGAGEFLLCASLAMDGITGAVQGFFIYILWFIKLFNFKDRIRHYYTTDKWTMMFSMNAFSSVFLSIMLIVSGELIAFFNFLVLYPGALREILLFSVTGAIGQV